MITAIKETLFTPSVRVIEKDHRIVISGQSRLEDPTPFYEELISLLDEHIDEVKTHLSIDFVL
ncbi:MAG: SiaC family regulatory phosphoprotein, partial [Bacteroidales bacterium]|nr:SiaC family regulatory phosphoprotein [Bacteroidales bacterium]